MWKNHLLHDIFVIPPLYLVASSLIIILVMEDIAVPGMPPYADETAALFGPGNKVPHKHSVS